MTSTSYGEAERFVLSNGMRLFARRNARLPAVAMMAAVDAGSACDPGGKAGLSTLAVEALRTGTTSRDEDALADAFADLGASVRTDRGCDWIDVGTRVLSRDLERGLELVAETLTRPSFPEAKLERVRGELLAERESSRARADDLLIDAFYRVVYAGHRYEWPVNGTEKSLRALTRDDVLEFVRLFYRPERTTLALVGDLDPQATAAMVERLFGAAWPARPDHSARELAQLSDLETIDSRVAAAPPGGIYFVHKHDQSQAHVRVGHRSIGRAHADWDRLLVANYVLGGAGLSSRITASVRTQHGLAYSAGSFIVPRRFGGPFAAAAQTKSESVAKAIALMKEEVEKLRREAMPETDLETARLQFTGSLPFREETLGQKAGVLLEGALFGLPFDHIRRQIETAQTISPEEVREVAERYLDPASAATVVVGERDAILPRLRELGPVTELEPIP